MEKLQINILGKAPSQSDIEVYNSFYLKKKKFFERFSSLLFYGSMIIFLAGLALAKNNISDLVFLFFGFFWGLSVIFSFVGVANSNKIEQFISFENANRLKDIISKYPEVYSYNAQVISQGRSFLQNEYIACVNFERERL